MAGSLIKNPGGGIAPTGGYIAGTQGLGGKLRLSPDHPGCRSRKSAAHLGNNRELFMGAFHAPHVTGEALKTAAFTAGTDSTSLGFDVTPYLDGVPGRYHPGGASANKRKH